VLLKKLLDAFIFHPGSGRHPEVLAALVASSSTGKVWNQLVDILDVHGSPLTLFGSENTRFGLLFW
jgi:hypothetical protein